MPPVLPRFSLFGRAISRSYFRSNVANFSSKPRAQLQRGYQNYRYQRFQETRSFLQAWARRPTFYAEMGGLGAVVGGVYYWNLETVPVREAPQLFKAQYLIRCCYRSQGADDLTLYPRNKRYPLPRMPLEKSCNNTVTVCYLPTIREHEWYDASSTVSYQLPA